VLGLWPPPTFAIFFFRLFILIEKIKTSSSEAKRLIVFQKQAG